jgi:hypothetical protein
MRFKYSTYILLVAISSLFYFCESGNTTNSLFVAEPIAGNSVHVEINEASGMVASRKYPGLLWTHNDSGDKPRLFLIKPDGDLVATVYLEDVFNRDWEDIAAYYDKAEEKYFLFVGDIGDNRAVYDYKYIYRIEEPAIELDKTEQLVFVKDVEKIIFQYTDGSRDAETLLFDPLDNNIYLISKREEKVGLYLFTPGFSWGDTLYIEKIVTLPISYAVAGDISANGKEIIIKNYDQIFYWERGANETLADVLEKEPLMLPYLKEKQGESIAWNLNASGFYTLSEQAEAAELPKVYFYKRN